MKRKVILYSWPLWKDRWRKILMTGRAYILLSLCSMLLFILLGLGGMLQRTIAVTPVQSMKGFTANVSGHFFHSLLGMELPHMTPVEDKDKPLQSGRIAAFLLRFLTDLNPNDPKSLLAMELPGMPRDHSVLLRSGSGEPDAPKDYGPLEESSQQPARNDPEPELVPMPKPAPSQNTTPNQESEDAAKGRKVVFIYHSHNRESWYPELKANKKDPNSDTVNITLVGKRLAQELEDLGVGSTHSAKDYFTTVRDYNWNFSYKYSLQTLTHALSSNKQLKFFFDIHRDSQRRKKTTVTIHNKAYAQVYFIIGHRNPDWRENEQFANQIHEKLDKDYPGLSRGVWGKTAANGNGEYNQSIAPNSVLLEIGGVDNTLEESYRTVEVLAEAIAQLYWDNEEALKVMGQE